MLRILITVFFSYGLLTWTFGQNDPPKIIVEESIKKASKIELKTENTAENDSTVLNFAADLLNILRAQDAVKFKNKFHSASFMQKMKNNLKSQNSIQSSYIDIYTQGVVAGIQSQMDNMVADFTREYIDLVNYRFDIIEETYFLLFRFFDSKRGLNYIDFQLNKVDDRWYFIDFFGYYTGQYLSETAGFMMKEMLFKFGKEELVTEKEKGVLNFLLQSGTLIDNKEYEKAYSLFEEHKEDLQGYINLYIFKCVIAGKISEEAYAQSLEELMDAYPEDPKISLITLDYFILQKQFDKAYNALYILMNDTQDSFLQFIMANLKFDENKLEEAKDLYTEVIRIYPEFTDAYLNFNDLYLSQHLYDKVIENFNTMLKNNFKKNEIIKYYEQKNANDEYLYPQFIKSSVFKDWKFNALN